MKSEIIDPETLRTHLTKLVAGVGARVSKHTLRIQVLETKVSKLEKLVKEMQEQNERT